MRDSRCGIGTAGGRTPLLGAGLIIALLVATGHAFQPIKIVSPEGRPTDEFGFAVSLDPLGGRAVAVGSNDLRGGVAWDVTADVMTRGTRAWTIRKAEEDRLGEV